LRSGRGISRGGLKRGEEAEEVLNFDGITEFSELTEFFGRSEPTLPQIPLILEIW
jgi:hypothetical protein